MCRDNSLGRKANATLGERCHQDAIICVFRRIAICYKVRTSEPILYDVLRCRCTIAASFMYLQRQIRTGIENH